MNKKTIGAVLVVCMNMLAVGTACAKDYHVSKSGIDGNAGTQAKPFNTISAAAKVAQPGDVITVHEGVYRERVNPPRGGDSDAKRIVYQAAKDEKVVINGSEIVKGWQKVKHDTWKVELANRFFGDFNPYADLIRGDWFNPRKRPHHTGAVYLDGHWLVEASVKDEVMKPVNDQALWFAEVRDGKTTIWAQLPGVDPNRQGIEINVRQAVFYPSKTGRNFITVRGFTLEHAATNWAPPTAEQVGLIGTHWSKGWVIKDNTIRYSVCTGVTLGKHGDKFDNTSADTATGYVETIKRGLAAGWSKENIGSHVVRNNHISHCEQAGIVGSLGCAFSTVTGNEIHDIHIRQLFTGAEMGAIKFHAPIDTLISDNHIYRAGRGIWLDWMTQGTHVTRNLVHDISPREDLFVEVNHGPFLIDHNLFLSKTSLLDVSEGGAYAHNLFAGKVKRGWEPRRETPWQEEHGTKIAGLATTKGGDNRFFNNVFIAPAGLDHYDNATLPNRFVGNVFLNGAKPSKHEKSPLRAPDIKPGLKLEKTPDGWWLEMSIDPAILNKQMRTMVTTDLLGTAKISNAKFEQPDGTPYKLDSDYFGEKRNTATPAPGPFEFSDKNKIRLKVWPKNLHPPPSPQHDVLNHLTQKENSWQL